MPPTKVRLDREAAAKFLADHHFRIRPGTLAAYGYRGNGPRYVLSFGRAVYEPADLLAWAEAHCRQPA